MIHPAAKVTVPARLINSPHHDGAVLHEKEVRVIALTTRYALVEYQGRQHRLPKSWIEMQ